MVDREQDLGKRDVEIPHQRPGESVSQSAALTDQELRRLFPGKYEYERKQLEVTGKGVEEVGIHSSGERIEVYDLNREGKRIALRGVLTGYQGTFGRGDDRNKVTIDVIGTLVGDEMSTEFYTDIPGFNLLKYGQAIAKKGRPFSLAVNKNIKRLVLASKTPAGLLSDLTALEVEVHSRLSLRSRRHLNSLSRARAVAGYVKSNFYSERPPDQPGRVKVKGQ